MLRNHIKFAIRIFKKDGVYSVLNILGLTLGITVGIILLLFLQNELNYDRHHERADQIYRVTHHLKATGADFNTARTSRELADKLRDEMPEIIETVRFNDYGNTMVIVKDENGKVQKFYEESIYETDSSLFKVFTHEVIAGDPTSCLVGPGKAVLTESIAKKYFGKSSAIGQIIELSEEGKREVSAVISDLPPNSHLRYEILLSEVQPRTWIANAKDAMRISEGFWNPGIYTYALVPKGYDPASFNQKFENIFEKYFRPFADRINGSAQPLLQPLTSIHFESKLQNDEPQGNISYVYTFATIGFFLIFLACINYMNLATARSVYRAGEMGIRKVLGTNRVKLFWSILIEAMVLAIIAMLLSIAASYVILEWTPFNSWIDKSLRLDFIGNSTLVAGILLITATVGLLSGVYPAVYIPSVPVVTALKGSFTGQRKGAMLRKGLIILQFVVSIFVVITTVMMDRQIDYMKTVDLGFNQENVLLTQFRGEGEESQIKGEAIRAELERNPNVLATALAWGVPGIDFGGQVFKVQQGDELVQQSLNTIHVAQGYMQTMELELVQGRDFHDDNSDWRKSVIINEAAAKAFGWTDPINKRFRFFHGDHDMHVIGVVKDFNYLSLHNKIEPMFLMPYRGDGGTLHIRVKRGELEETIQYVKDVMNEFDPNHPFEYQFLDTEFEKQYQADQIQHLLISTLSFICIFISILGLIGLSAFTVGQKAKEISIRRTLGASIGHVLVLFSKGYIKLILVAMIVAIPLADYVLVDWLTAFAYQMPINWIYYVIPGLVVLLFGLSTVLLQSLKAARANPVDGLRSE